MNRRLRTCATAITTPQANVTDRRKLTTRFEYERSYQALRSNAAVGATTSRSATAAVAAPIAAAATPTFSALTTAPTIPADFKQRNALADIRLHPNGKFVYASNRGHDSLAIFRIEDATGRMIPVDIASTQGGNPREFDFEPSGKFLFVGNQTTNQMVTFGVDPDTGKITPTGAKIDVPKPACVKFLTV